MSEVTGARTTTNVPAVMLRRAGGATRKTQPYRKLGVPRLPGQALQNMLRGRTMTGTNPMDIQRGVQRLARAAASSRRKRPGRPARPTRTPR